MKRIIITLSLAICFVSTPAFAAVQSGTSSSSLLNAKASQYYQNPSGAQQAATNISSSASGSVLLNQSTNKDLKVDSPALVTDSSKLKSNNRSDLYLILAVFSLLFMTASVVMYVLSKKQGGNALDVETVSPKDNQEVTTKEELAGILQKPAKNRSNKKARRKREKKRRK